MRSDVANPKVLLIVTNHKEMHTVSFYLGARMANKVMTFLSDTICDSELGYRFSFRVIDGSQFHLDTVIRAH